jgi:hypothetical protein
LFSAGAFPKSLSAISSETQPTGVPTKLLWVAFFKWKCKYLKQAGISQVTAAFIKRFCLPAAFLYLEQGFIIRQSRMIRAEASISGKSCCIILPIGTGRICLLSLLYLLL